MRGKDEQSLSHPNQFLGLFEHTSRLYAPLFEEARRELRALPVPEVIRHNYEFCVLDRQQPAFMLLPLMYLSLADHLGGITERHRQYLPWQMLAMELAALYDDTVDHTPCRSGFPTYQARYGPESAAALAGFLYSVLVAKTAAFAPELLPLLTSMFEKLCAMEVWELQSRYPDISVSSFAAWIRHRYDVIAPVNAYSLDSALLLYGAERLSYEALARFGDLGQDVDDIVNIVEEREKSGENDDLKLGIVTYPLLATLEAKPSAKDLIEAVWHPFRPSGAHPSPGFDEDEQAQDAHRTLVDLMRRYGVPATIDKTLTDAEASIAATPPHLKPCMRAFNFGFLNRLRLLDPRARFEGHAHLPQPNGVWTADVPTAGAAPLGVQASP